jgi:hypothetical protein
MNSCSVRSLFQINSERKPSPGFLANSLAFDPYSLSSNFLLFIQVYCPYATLGYERPTPPSLTDINIHSDTQAEPRKLSSLTLYQVTCRW